MRRWMNWSEYLKAKRPEGAATFDNFIAALKSEYQRFTPAFAEAESGVAAETIAAVAREIGRAGSASRRTTGADRRREISADGKSRVRCIS